MKPTYPSEELRHALGRIDQLLATLASLHSSIFDIQIDIKQAPAEAIRQLQALQADLETRRENVISDIEKIANRLALKISEEFRNICPESLNQKLHEILD